MQHQHFIEWGNKQGYVYFDNFWYNIKHEGMLFTTKELIAIYQLEQWKTKQQ